MSPEVSRASRSMRVIECASLLWCTCPRSYFLTEGADQPTARPGTTPLCVTRPTVSAAVGLHDATGHDEAAAPDALPPHPAGRQGAAGGGPAASVAGLAAPAVPHAQAAVLVERAALPDRDRRLRPRRDRRRLRRRPG